MEVIVKETAKNLASKREIFRAINNVKKFSKISSTGKIGKNLFYKIINNTFIIF